MAKRPKARTSRPSKTAPRHPSRAVEPSPQSRMAVTSVVAWPPAPPPPGPAPAAVTDFEKGMAALQRHAYADAAEMFRSIAARFPGERALLERVRVYLDLCERELRRTPPAPKTVEERLTAATAALNDGDDDRADALARSVVDDDADQDLAHYLLAAIAARRGAAEEALGHLARSVALSPEAGAQARFDADFEGLRSHDDFRRLTEPPQMGAGTPTAAGARRLRRGRVER
jgi:tetratricopeptide (TPR) repeat protein